MRKIAVVSAGRSDYGIYRPILKELTRRDDVELEIIVTGSHLTSQFGNTVDEIKADGYKTRTVNMLLSSDSPEAVAKSSGLGIIGFAQLYAESAPDLLVVLGDRYDMLTSVIAALPFNIPIGHIHGGELTERAIGEQIRHAITKMSHLHFASHEEYANRIIQMGEEPWRVHVTGAPGLDNLHSIEYLSKVQLSRRLGLDLERSPLLVTFHPVTLEYQDTEIQINELLNALTFIELPVVITYPNSDTNNNAVINGIDNFVRHTRNSVAVKNLGTQAYMSLMRYAMAMVGNSSSGIIEAASFGLPVVNIGHRQDGRLRGKNIIDVDCATDKIIKAIQKAISKEFRQLSRSAQNPYGDGAAAKKIVECLCSVKIDKRLLFKKFNDIISP